MAGDSLRGSVFWDNEGCIWNRWCWWHFSLSSEWGWGLKELGAFPTGKCHVGQWQSRLGISYLLAFCILGCGSLSCSRTSMATVLLASKIHGTNLHKIPYAVPQILIVPVLELSWHFIQSILASLKRDISKRKICVALKLFSGLVPKRIEPPQTCGLFLPWWWMLETCPAGWSVLSCVAWPQRALRLGRRQFSYGAVTFLCCWACAFVPQFAMPCPELLSTWSGFYLQRAWPALLRIPGPVEHQTQGAGACSWRRQK